MFRTIVWATGYHLDYTWLKLPVLDTRDRIRHTGGVMQGSPGGVADGTQECNPLLRPGACCCVVPAKKVESTGATQEVDPCLRVTPCFWEC